MRAMRDDNKPNPAPASQQHESDVHALVAFGYAATALATQLAVVWSLLRAKGLMSDDELSGQFDAMAAGAQEACSRPEATPADLQELDISLAVLSHIRGHLKV